MYSDGNDPFLGGPTYTKPLLLQVLSRDRQALKGYHKLCSSVISRSMMSLNVNNDTFSLVYTRHWNDAFVVHLLRKLMIVKKVKHFVIIMMLLIII